MNRIWLTLIGAICATLVGASHCSGVFAAEGNSQSYQPESRPYQPAVPAGSTNNVAVGGWGGYGGTPGTAAGSALSGMSQVISSAGQYNLATSAAAVNMTQAQRNQIQNDALATDTYFQMRATNRAAVAAERGPKPTMEQLVRLSRVGVPKPLSANQMDPVSGKLYWPGPLQEAAYDEQRGDVDQLFTKYATYGGLPYSDQSKVRDDIDAMFGQLRSQIKEIPPMDFVACRGFLSSLLYATTKTQLQ